MFLSKLAIFIILSSRFGNSITDISFCPENICQSMYTNNTTPHSPNNMSLAEFEDQPCFCDEDCWKYKDCCSDAQLPQQVLQSNTSFEMSCHKITKNSHSVYIIKTCPSDWRDNETRLFCERKIEDRKYQPILDIPYYSLTTMNSYLNIYCAKCNGDNLNATILKFIIKCTALDLGECVEDFWIKSSYVAGQLKWLLPNGDVMEADIVDPKFTSFRKCREVEDTCASNWTDFLVRQLCYNSSSRYVYDSYGTTYKNIHCARCNYKSLTQLLCVPVKDPSLHTAVVSDFDEIQFNWILDFTLSSNKRCTNVHDIYDEFMKICLSLSCGQNYDLVDGECVLQSNLRNNTSNFSEYSCIKIPVPITELFLFPNRSVYWNRTQIIYSAHEIEENDNSSYILCVDDYELSAQISGVRQFSVDQSLLSKICMWISLVCVATHIIIHCITGQQRKLPGKCLLNLSVTLFTGNLLFVVGVNRTENEIICSIIGILIHFCLLAVFFWMNVMAIDICRTFTRAFRRSSWNSKTFIYYNIYAWLTPLIIVVTAIAIDFVHPESDICPRYGQDVCWISNRYALFIFFALPLAIILVANIILFIITACNIHKTTKICENLQKSCESERFQVYVKLSFIMGFPWIMGFAAVFTNFEPLWYAFTILNASQGTFLFIIFSLKRNVLNQLYFKLTGKLPRKISISRRTDSILLRP